CRGFDRGEGRRRWRALDVGLLKAFVEADAPRVRCPAHGVVGAAVPWARHGAGHTRAVDDTTAWLAAHASKQAVRELLRTAWATVGRIGARVAADAEEACDRFEGLGGLGTDGTSYKKGHRDLATLLGFFDLLGPERCDKIRLVSADAAEWAATVVAERCRAARLCLDPFHVARVGQRRAGRGPPPGLEHRPPAGRHRSCPRVQGRSVRVMEEPRRPHWPPARQARL